MDGKRYLDFNSMTMCVDIGHGDERVINITEEQLAEGFKILDKALEITDQAVIDWK